MHWERTWKWILTVLVLILAARMYFVQELLTLFLFFSFAFVVLLLLVGFSLIFLQLIDRGMDFLEPRLRALGTSARILLSEAFHRLLIVLAESQLNPVSVVPIVIKQIQSRISSLSHTRMNRGA
ncbi:MAG: hypothetical protein WBL63_19095 [Candidatus Acidiferrum sp.]